MRILMMGTGGFAVPVFQWLLDSEHEVPALVTRPKAGRRDRRSKITDPMREVAERRNVIIHDPGSINTPEAIALVRKLSPELMVVCDYGQILAHEVLALAPKGGINLHASLLPKYRGAAPINWAIFHGERETGVTVIHMTPQLDAGPCLQQQVVTIGERETSPQLEARLAELGVTSVSDSIAQLATWEGSSVLGEIQRQAEATKAPRLKKSDGLLDWSRSAHQLDSQIRAMKPWPGTFSFLPR
ncbi:MAG: methionyl-tRNA formyltransferase, partial [Planctomycetota bacterium]